MKIGRNDPCPCDSGKKYKKCCYPKTVVQIMQEKMGKPEKIDHKGRLVGRPFIQTDWKDKKVRAVGNRLYHSLPKNETFHEFIIRVLKDTVGMEWGLEESKKTKNEQHIIVQWIGELGELIKKKEEIIIEDKEKDIKSFEQTGNIRDLLSLAYDVYTVLHCGDLPEDLLKRLKNRDNFQGARYEIAVAAIFMRAGYTISWINDKTQKSCEFIAKHKDSGEEIAVEAKSRHRPGVLEMRGALPDIENLKTGVEREYNRAVKQQPVGIPFIVAIDLNLPLTPEAPPLMKSWISDIKLMFDNIGKPTKESPDPTTAVFITNFSWHYQGDKKAIQKSESLMIIPKYSKYPLKNPQTLNTLHDALNEYGYVPHDV